MARLINIPVKVATDFKSGDIMSSRKTQRFEGAKPGHTNVSRQSSNSQIVYGRRLALNPNAVQAVVLLLGLAVITTPSWGHPGAPMATLAVGQAEPNDVRRQAEELLRRARVAMKAGDLELAEQFVVQAEKLKVSYNGFFVSRLADTPQKARKDLQRLKQSRSRSNGSRLPNLFGKKSSTSQQGGSDNDVELAQTQRLPNDTTQNRSALPAGEVANPYVNRSYPSTGKTDIVGDASRPPSNEAVASPQQKQQRALRLVAQAQAALDRGDLTLAGSFAQQANQLNVPELAFDSGDTPWELMLKVNKQRRLQGTVPASAQLDDPAGEVANAIYDANNDTSFTRTASSEQSFSSTTAILPPQQAVSGQHPLLEQPAPLDIRSVGAVSNALGQSKSDATAVASAPRAGAVVNHLVSPQTSALLNPVGMTISDAAPVELIKLGEDALRQGNLDDARNLFRQAWSFERELDQTARQRLQEHLQILRANISPEQTGDNNQSQQEQLRIRRVIADVGRQQVAIARELRASPKNAWERMQQLRRTVQDADVPDVARKPLLARLDQAVHETEHYIEQNRAQIELDERNRDVLAAIDRERRLKVEMSRKLARMVDEFNELMRQQRFSEAYILAKQARELDPQNPVVVNLIWKSRFAERMYVELSLRERHAIGLEGALESVSESGIGFDDRNPIRFPKRWDSLVKQRQSLLSDRRSRYTAVEQKIQRALHQPIHAQFDEMPLADVIATLGRVSGINVHLDTQGLAAEGVTSQTPITINLTEEVSLESVLNLILEPLRLGFVIQDEVLRITSEQARAGDVYNEVYYVGDLVIPIPNFMPGYQNGMAGALAQAHRALGYGPGLATAQSRPLAVLADAESQQLGSQASVLAQMSASDMLTGNSSGQPMGFGPGGLGGASQADFDTLIELISSTVAPDTWDDVGGPGSMAPFEGNLSLVISNTQEVHEEIVDLLEQLRRLQDLQVTIEVRFITLQDNFFERLGVDFDFDIRDGTGLTQQDIADDAANNTEDLDITIGLDPQGNPTLDLDLTFNQNSFASAIPAFGGFDAGSAATFGFAILSDIEAFFVFEAIQGDVRTNVMQAPKITLFNGQFANINDTSNRPFVTSVVPVVGDFAVAQQPVILVLSEGTQLNVQAVVSNDRRFVRLTLLPMFSQIGDVETFTFEGRRTSATGSTVVVDPSDNTETTATNDEQFTEGTTVQLPTFATTSISTTVSVPDGGTVLLGGIKRLAEGRNERGLPIVSKLPYISRLFTNVGIGRETNTLMMMVTPRIIIQEEEEERILGTPSP